MVNNPNDRRLSLSSTALSNSKQQAKAWEQNKRKQMKENISRVSRREAKLAVRRAEDARFSADGVVVPMNEHGWIFSLSSPRLCSAIRTAVVKYYNNHSPPTLGRKATMFVPLRSSLNKSSQHLATSEDAIVLFKTES